MAKKTKKSWKELLKDTKTYGDDFAVQIGETSYTMGELREMEEESNGALSAQLDERKKQLDQQQQNLEAAQQTLTQLYNEFTEAAGVTLDDIQSGKAKPKGKKAAASTSDDPEADLLAQYESDEASAPLVKYLRKQAKIIEGLNAELVGTKKIAGVMGKTYLDDYYERQFSLLPTPENEEAKKKITMKALIEHATEQGYKDNVGRLNLRRAHKDLMEPYTIAEIEKKAFEKGKKEATDALTMARMPKPGNNGFKREPLAAQAAQERGEKFDTSFDAALARAAEDDEIWQNAFVQ